MYRLIAALFSLAVALPALAAPWRQYASPEDAGWSSQSLESVRADADSFGTGAFMLIHDGKVITAWGDLSHRFECRSVRKSLLSALVGVAIEHDELSLNDSLADLGVIDLAPLTELERSTTVCDMLTSRSAVYLPAAMEPSDVAESRPERGSDKPGARWWYNNWGFNALGTIVEQAGGADVFDLFRARIAEPLGMQDYNPGDCIDVLEPRNSIHAAYDFRMSARDLARFGQLYLDGGSVGGERLLTESWVIDSTNSHIKFPGGDGYGYLWWTYPAFEEGHHFAAQGTAGQLIYIAPELDAVVVHLRQPGMGPPAPGEEERAVQLVRSALQARTGEPNADSEPVEVTPSPLAATADLRTPAPLAPIDAGVIATLLGRYQAERGPWVELFEHEGRLFLAVPITHRQFELLGDGKGGLASPAAPITLEITSTRDDKATGLRINAFGRPLEVAR